MLSSLSTTFIRNFPNRVVADMMCIYVNMRIVVGDLQLNCVNQLGKGADVFLASAELAAVAAIEGNIAID